jgi:uncharacterized protein
MKKLLTSLTLFLLLPLQASALSVPKLQGYVNDYAHMISGPTKAKLEEELKSFEQSDSTQLVILTIPSLEGESPEDYSIRVVEAWKLGQARKDNGILLLVSKDDRKLRIEVGRGLEGRLTDLMAGRIIDLVIKPWFKRGDFDGGFAAGVASLIDAARGEFKAEQKDSRKGTQPFSSFWLFLIGGFILFFFILSSARKRGRTSNWGDQNGRSHGRSPGGFFVFPSGRGGESGPFGGGGGTFGGGGGSFGGGGASGSW